PSARSVISARSLHDALPIYNLIENDYPKMVEAFGDQFQLIFVNVTTEDGRALAQAAYEAYGIPSDQRYVPMMFIGEHVLVGGYEDRKSTRLNSSHVKHSYAV